jgi:hypothetical protein
MNHELDAIRHLHFDLATVPVSVENKRSGYVDFVKVVNADCEILIMTDRLGMDDNRLLVMVVVMMIMMVHMTAIMLIVLGYSVNKEQQ